MADVTQQVTGSELGPGPVTHCGARLLQALVSGETRLWVPSLVLSQRWERAWGRFHWGHRGQPQLTSPLKAIKPLGSTTSAGSFLGHADQCESPKQSLNTFYGKKPSKHRGVEWGGLRRKAKFTSGGDGPQKPVSSVLLTASTALS